MDSKDEILLRTNNLSAGYSGKNVFEGLNLQLVRGELICFMGPNGAGKSTLIRTLAGLQARTGGTIEYPALTSGARNTHQYISLVLTDPILAPYMTVFDLVSFGRYPFLDWRLKMSDADINLIETSIEKVNISHLRARRLIELSDGQRQMAMIARALAQDTSILMLDEPTAHLDLNNRVEIMRTLKAITRATNKAVLMATHELDLALQTADLIWLAGTNKTLLTGIPEELVLNGSFDDIFQFKGFDLRTGRVQHYPFRNQRVFLQGEGHPFLWTRNLLERNGFEIVSAAESDLRITIKPGDVPSWVVNETQVYYSIKELLNYLETV